MKFLLEKIDVSLLKNWAQLNRKGKSFNSILVGCCNFFLDLLYIHMMIVCILKRVVLVGENLNSIFLYENM